jgi:hypothetical protein
LSQEVRGLAQLDGKDLAIWLASSPHDPGRLIGLEMESTEDNTWGRIAQIDPDAVEIKTETGRQRVAAQRLRSFVVQDIPADLKREIEADVSGMPVAHTEAVKRRGFDDRNLGRAELRMLINAIDSVESQRKCPYEAVELLGKLLSSRENVRPSQDLLRSIMVSPFKSEAGFARIKLAQAASARGDLAMTRELTDPARMKQSEDALLIERHRAILLTIQAACVAQLGQRCEDLRNAKRAADMAFAINGKSDELTNTYDLIRRRQERLGCPP